ncbi:phosphorylated adapter RNA export protein [Alosa pseudoharengus]|uniref:phosphorylated adapter RNA export protein n=1 Tax=Alosa pseudoharengus TaxID=34774 RepID=UPI003F8BCDA3
MAGENRDTMEELEDGELSGSNSDSEMGSNVDRRGQMSAAPAFTNQSFQSRAPAQPAPSATGYRNMPAAVSSGSDSDSDEDATLWRTKRQKCSHAPPPPSGPARTPALPFGASAASAQAGRKVNNIWGSVVQEQNQDVMATELGIIGLEGDLDMQSRQSEAYNYVFARKMMERERELERERQEQDESAMLDDELEDYMKKKGPSDDHDSQLKRKRSAKERLGPRAEMDFQGRYEVTEDDPKEKVIDEIAHRLMEPKKDLIERVVNVIGNKKAIELLSETATIEQNGGLYTVDGSRRRTPGGVYLNLLKNTPSITHEQVKEIFQEENQRECQSKKAAKKRRRHIVAKKMKQALNTLDLQEHDDVSRETFASDTNEALESLEEVPEDTVEPPIGTEDTPVVYNSNDLEVF